MKYLLLIALSLVSCASTAPASDGSSQEANSSLVAGRGWTLTFEDGCSLKGTDDLATSGKCPNLGNANFDGELSRTLGAKVAKLTMVEDHVASVRLSHAGATYYVAADDAGPIEFAMKDEMIARVIAKREQGLEGAESCGVGEVVLEYYSFRCLPLDGDRLDLEGCSGAPFTRCGAPLKVGERCNFNTSCESESCTYLNRCG